MQVIVYGPAIIASVAGFMGIMITNLFGIDAKWRIPVALITIIAIGLMNFLKNNVTAAFSVITTIGKMIPITAIIIFGLFWGHQDALGQTVSEVNRSTGGFGVAVLATLFGYDGWILITNLSGEMKNPQKLLPKAIILGISSVLVIYTLITIGIFRFVPANMIHSLGDNTTSYLTTKAFGKIGGKLLSIEIIISMMGTLNGKIITFPRIVYAMARRGDLPFSRMLSYVTPKGKATIMMLFFDPDHLSYLCVFTIYCFYLMTVFGIFILRKKNKKRPFSTPLYPLVPIIAIGGGIFVLISELFNDPAGVLLFVGIVVIGLPVLYVVKRMNSKRLK